MDPLSPVASVVGVAVPALQCVQQLQKTIQAIRDAPSDITSLGEELLTIEQAITSIQKIPYQQWQSLGSHVASFKLPSIIGLDIAKMESCLGATERQSVSLGRTRYNRHHLNFRTVKVLLPQLLPWRLCSRSSLQQATANEAVMRIVSAKETEIAKTLSATEKKLEEVNDRLKKLHLASLEVVEEDPDEARAKSQVETEKFALQQSLELLKALRENIQSVVRDMGKGQGQVINGMSFGDHNKGVQAGISNAPINFSIGQNKDD